MNILSHICNNQKSGHRKNNKPQNGMQISINISKNHNFKTIMLISKVITIDIPLFQFFLMYIKE